MILIGILGSFGINVYLATRLDNTVRSNEQLRFKNAKLQSANARLVEELSEGLMDWEDIEE